MKKYSGYFLITDLDGTLLNTNKEISPTNQKALAEFTAQGGRFSVATGRSPARKNWYPSERMPKSV